MKITEAMAEVKLAVKKIQTSFEFVMRNLRREEWRKDPFEKDGTTQEAQVRAALQSIQDNEDRIVALKFAINRTNMATTLEIEGRNWTVAEWLIWRRDVLPIKKKNLAQLANAIANVGQSEVMIQRRFVGQQQEQAPVVSNWIINVSDKWLLKEIQDLEAIEQRLDGQLSILNANEETAV